MRPTSMRHLTLLLSTLLLVSATYAEQQWPSHEDKGNNDTTGKEDLPQTLKEEDGQGHQSLPGDNFDDNIFVSDSVGCSFPFVEIGTNCYFFSEELKNFDDSITYCENLAPEHSLSTTIAMLGNGEAEDEAVLGEAVKRGKNYWVGGKTVDNVHWKWTDGRDINLQDSFWFHTEPNTAQYQCASAQVTSGVRKIRSYLFDYDCNEKLNFICQTSYEFRRIGFHWYFFSEGAGLPRRSWSNARDYCRSLSVPIGYHSDLAVLGMADQDSYNLMDTFAAAYDYPNTWLGGYAPTDCAYQWVDGRPLDVFSHYWYYTQPSCGTYNRAYLYHNTNTNRTHLLDSTDDHNRPFICQVFKD